MTKHLNITIKKEKEQMDESSLVIRNIQKILNGFETSRKMQLQSGKADDNPEIIFINKKIHEFEKDLQTLKANSPFQSTQ
nr:hypothetical protein [uncultured Caproiciproducens sp.]